MTTHWMAAVVLMIGVGAGAAPVWGQDADSAAAAGADRFIGLLRTGDWAAAEQMVEEGLRDRLGAAQLEAVWGQLTGALGALEGTELRGVTPTEGLRAVELYGAFERDRVLMRVVLSATGSVSGFWVGPAPDEASDADETGPPYADRGAFREEEITVGAAPWELPATLTVPAGGGRHPAVILVHGSGPHDRDETVGGAKVFRDLAWGLASRGVAVLRYEKRTRTHGAKMGGEVTIDSEVIDDALSALEVARRHASVDPERVYVLGHSLGAQLAPEIARRDGRAAGAIMAAAAARPIGEVMMAQLEYLGTLPENASPDAQAQLEAALAQVRRLTSGEAPDGEVIMGAPASYFRALDARDALGEARRLTLPILVLQGERDYQVTMTDYEMWRSALASRPATTFRSFPPLNHLFVEGTGPATPSEYMAPGFVSVDVIEAIRAWIAGHSGAN